MLSSWAINRYPHFHFPPRSFTSLGLLCQRHIKVTEFLISHADLFSGFIATHTWGLGESPALYSSKHLQDNQCRGHTLVHIPHQCAKVDCNILLGQRTCEYLPLAKCATDICCVPNLGRAYNCHRQCNFCLFTAGLSSCLPGSGS